MEDLADHNLITFKSHREALDDWAIRELIGHYVAYRKLVSISPSRLLAEDHFRLYAVCARYPHNLSGRVPWQELRPGVYDCRWGLDVVRVVVAGQLPRETHNAPLHLFSASPELVGFAGGAYRRRSQQTSRLLGQLFENLRAEGYAVSFTMEDFNRQYFKEHFSRLTPAQRREVLQSLPPAELLQSLPPEEQEAVLQSLPPERRLAGLSEDQIRRYLERLRESRPAASRRPGRKK